MAAGSANSKDIKAIHDYWQRRVIAAQKDIEMAQAAQQIAQNSVDRKLIKHFVETRFAESEAYRKMANATKPGANYPSAPHRDLGTPAENLTCPDLP